MLLSRLAAQYPLHRAEHRDRLLDLKSEFFLWTFRFTDKGLDMAHRVWIFSARLNTIWTCSGLLYGSRPTIAALSFAALGRRRSTAGPATRTQATWWSPWGQTFEERLQRRHWFTTRPTRHDQLTDRYRSLLILYVHFITIVKPNSNSTTPTPSS